MGSSLLPHATGEPDKGVRRVFQMLDNKQCRNVTEEMPVRSPAFHRGRLPGQSTGRKSPNRSVILGPRARGQTSNSTGHPRFKGRNQNGASGWGRSSRVSEGPVAFGLSADLSTLEVKLHAGGKASQGRRKTETENRGQTSNPRSMHKAGNMFLPTRKEERPQEKILGKGLHLW